MVRICSEQAGGIFKYFDQRLFFILLLLQLTINQKRKRRKMMCKERRERRHNGGHRDIKMRKWERKKEEWYQGVLAVIRQKCISFCLSPERDGSWVDWNWISYVVNGVVLAPFCRLPLSILSFAPRRAVDSRKRTKKYLYNLSPRSCSSQLCFTHRYYISSISFC